MDAFGLVIQPDPFFLLPWQLFHHVGLQDDFLLPCLGRSHAGVDSGISHELLDLLFLKFLFIIDFVVGNLLALTDDTWYGFEIAFLALIPNSLNEIQSLLHFLKHGLYQIFYLYAFGDCQQVTDSQLHLDVVLGVQVMAFLPGLQKVCEKLIQAAAVGGKLRQLCNVWYVQQDLLEDILDLFLLKRIIVDFIVVIGKLLGKGQLTE